jgi:hypothetical protein
VPDIACIREQSGTGFAVLGVGEAGTLASSCLHQDPVAGASLLVCARGGQRNAILMIHDFVWNTDRRNHRAYSEVGTLPVKLWCVTATWRSHGASPITRQARRGIA